MLSWASLWWRALSWPEEGFFFFTLVLLSRDGVPQVCDLGILLLDTFPSAWRCWHSVPKATLERGRSVEFPSEGNVSGYVCNHSSLRMGTRHCVSWPCFGHSCRSPLKKGGWCVPQAPFYARRRSLACVIGVHLQMSGVLGVVIMLQVTGHAGGVPKATLERGRSVSFQFSRNYGYIRNLRRFILYVCFYVF